MSLQLQPGLALALALAGERCPFVFPVPLGVRDTGFDFEAGVDGVRADILRVLMGLLLLALARFRSSLSSDSPSASSLIEASAAAFFRADLVTGALK
jgi:hypothetical protein